LLPNLSRPQQKGLIVLSTLILGGLFLSHWLTNRLPAPEKNSLPLPGNSFFIELADGVQRPGLYSYSRPTPIGQVIRDGGGLTGKMGIPSPLEREVLNQETQLSCSADPAHRLVIQRGPLSVKSLWSLGRPIPLNKATAEELDRIPGIGPGLARRMVEHRDAQGPFPDLEELRQVKGIGDKTLEKIRPFLTVP
jgi:competence protein ComEA